MAAVIVYEGVPNAQGETGTLFQGQKMWFSATVPQRKWLVANVEAYGGEVVPLEKQADILIVDHKRKNPPPGTHSYQYVELSIRKGLLENLNDHVVGGTSRADRPVGSITMAPKGGRNPYTEADDQFLWNWVKPLEEAGGATAGNSIYQQLEAVNSRHTYQSWRDRWLKYVRHQKREITAPVHQEEEHVQPTPRRQRVQPRTGDSVESRSTVARQAPAEVEHRPRQGSVEVIIPARNGSSVRGSALPTLTSKGKAYSRRNAEHEKSGKAKFTDDEYDQLFEAASQILITQADRISNAWSALAMDKEKEAKEEVAEAEKKGTLAMEIPVHLAAEWRAYFDTVVGPDYDEQLEEETGRRRENYLTAGEDVPEGANAEVHQDENISHTASAQSTTLDTGRGRSSSFEPESPILSTSRPESPTASFSTTQERAPGPNEARKRSGGKGTNSQESTNSIQCDAGSLEELSQESTLSQKRKRGLGTDDIDEDSPSLPPFGNQEQAKRRRKSEAEQQRLEIPSTPEPERDGGKNDGPDEDQELSQEACSSTPRPRNYPQKHHGREDVPSSPLFVPQENKLSIGRWSYELEGDLPSQPIDTEEDQQLPATPRRRRREADQELRTSPLSVRLVSDQYLSIGSSISQSRSDMEKENGSPTPEFETAPEFSQVWETAQEKVEVPRPNTQRLRDRIIAETQPRDDFTLPEPEGGWDDLPLPPEANEEEAVLAEDKSQDDEDTDSETESIGTWIAGHLEADPDADGELLLTAAGRADLDFKLADVVYQHLRRGRPVPENVKGIWTERDDQALVGNDAREIRRIEEKHGKDSLEGRWHYVEHEQR